MAWDWQHLGSALGGAATLKTAELALQWWKGRADHSLAETAAREVTAAQLREELRTDVTRLLRRVEGLEQDVDQWRRSYWQVVEEREALKQQNRSLSAMVDSLTDELAQVKKRAEHLEAQVHALEVKLDQGAAGGERDVPHVAPQ